MMLGYLGIDFKCPFFVGSLIFLEAVDCFRWSLDVEAVCVF